MLRTFMIKIVLATTTALAALSQQQATLPSRSIDAGQLHQLFGALSYENVSSAEANALHQAGCGVIGLGSGDCGTLLRVSHEYLKAASELRSRHISQVRNIAPEAREKLTMQAIHSHDTLANSMYASLLMRVIVSSASKLDAYLIRQRLSKPLPPGAPRG